MGSLQDALFKAGVVKKGKKTEKKGLENKKQEKHEKKKIHSHQEHQTTCENCSRTYPDVERYKHRSPVVNGQWLCQNCADEFMISDEFRLTSQSEYNRSGIFRRRFGKTLKHLPLVEKEKEREREKENEKTRNGDGKKTRRFNSRDRFRDGDSRKNDGGGNRNKGRGFTKKV